MAIITEKLLSLQHQYECAKLRSSCNTYPLFDAAFNSKYETIAIQDDACNLIHINGVVLSL
jgi:hypothetical protein